MSIHYASWVYLLLFPTSTVLSLTNYYGYKVISILPGNEVQVEHLRTLWSQGEYDFWQPPSELNSTADVLVSPTQQHFLFSFLKRHDFQYRVMVHNLNRGGLAITYENTSPVEVFSRSPMKIFLKDLARAFPTLLTLDNIGTTAENREIVVAKLVTGYYDSSFEIKEMVDKIDWYVVPVLNPDGYEYTHTGSRLWRKNRRGCNDTYGISRSQCCGVDINRNFDWHHGEIGSSPRPCSEIYAGDGPFTEAESLAVKSFVEPRKRHIQVFLSFHSYAQKWLYAFGDTRRSYPDNFDEVSDLAWKAVRRLKESYGTKYKVGSSADMMYRASGLAADWVTGMMGIRWTYNVELRPCRRCHNTGFILRPEYIRPTAEETWEAVQAIAEEVLKRNKTMSERFHSLIRKRKSQTRKTTKTTRRTRRPSPNTTPNPNRRTGDKQETCRDEERPLQCHVWKLWRVCHRKDVKDLCRKTCRRC